MQRIKPQHLAVDSHHNVVIDLREYTEFAAGAIPGAKLVPLSTLPAAAGKWDRNASYVLLCKSGKRSLQAAEFLAADGFKNVGILEGGTEAWKQAGFPLQGAARRPWALERQVRVIAGVMVALSAILALAVSPWFLAWTLLVGVGLAFAGITDLCLMATVLGKMPWNRPIVETECSRH
ncbi:MAG TPA: rhodanese-like domain-containing protein [Candidatus Acidoferrum sp.]|nr:rhodanese-like domain-containing protein [Candidatus Acidoferrum sp.]